jgi:hypothetical protein
MNWRRGLMFAGIHLAIAVPLILSLEARDRRILREREQAQAEAAGEAAARPAEPASATVQSESGGTVRFDPDPCSMTVRYPASVLVGTSAAYLSVALTGWRLYCAPSWSLSQRLRAETFWVSTIEDQANVNAARRRVDRWFVVALVLQWFLMGSFPLLRPRAWWGEPGAQITACTVVGGLIALVPAIEGASVLTVFIALVAWFWWFGLLVWRLVAGGWRMVRLRVRAA